MTSVVLYLPLAQLALIRAWFQSGRAMFSTGVVLGLSVHTVVVALAYFIVNAFSP